MKNLFIPPLGTELELAEDWTFDLYGESRNWDFFERMGLDYPDHDVNWEPRCIETTLPAGSILKIDRIYIRKGQKDFDSVTFFLTFCRGKKVTKARFWVKLEDANKIILKD